MDISTISLATITDKNGNIDPKKLARQILKLQDREIKKHARREAIEEAELREELRKNNNAAAKQSTFYRYETATRVAKVERFYAEIPQTYPKALALEIKKERQRFLMREKRGSQNKEFSSKFKTALKKARVKLSPESFRQYVDQRCARTHYARGTAMDIINELARAENAHKHIAEPNPPVFLFGSIEDTIEARDQMQNSEGLELLAGVMGVPMTLPEFEDISPEEVRAQYIADCVEFLKQKHGERLVSVVMHTDERLRKNHYGERSIKGEDLHFILKPCPSGEIAHAGKQAVKAFLDSAEGQILKAKLQAIRTDQAQIKATRSRAIGEAMAQYAEQVRKFNEAKKYDKEEHDKKIQRIKAATDAELDAIYKDRAEDWPTRKAKMAAIRAGYKKYTTAQNNAFYAAQKAKPYPDKTELNEEIIETKREADFLLGETYKEAAKLSKEIKDKSSEAYKKAMSAEQQDFYEKVGQHYGLTRNGPKKKRYSKRELMAYKRTAAEELHLKITLESKAETLAKTNETIYKNMRALEELKAQQYAFAAKIEELKQQAEATAKATQENAQKFDYTAAAIKEMEDKKDELARVLDNTKDQITANLTEHYTSATTLAKRENQRRKRLEAMEAEEQKLLKQFTRADLSKPQPTNALGKIAASLKLTPKQKARARFAQLQRIKATITTKQKAATAANFGVLGGEAVFLEALKAEQNGKALDFNDYRKMLKTEIKEDAENKRLKATEQALNDKSKELQQVKRLGEVREKALIDLAKTIAKATGENAEKIKLDAIARNNHDRVTISNTAPQRPTQARPQAAGALIANTQQTASTYIQPRRPRM